MRLFRVLRMRLRSLFERRETDAELDAEIRFHLEQQIEENLALGMHPDEARYAALRAIGGVARIKEECRETRGVGWLENLASDLRYARRGLRKTPGFAAAAILSLTLGIGANTTVFTLTNAAFLNSLPVQEPSRVMEVYTVDYRAGTGGAAGRTAISVPNYRDFRDQNAVFGGLVADITSGVTLTGRGEPKIKAIQLVSANYFDVLGVRAFLGRTFLPEEDRKPTPVAVLSYSLWQDEFAGEQGVIGKSVELNSTAYTIIGVAPPEFKGTFTMASSDVIWVPMSMHQAALAGTLETFFANRRMRMTNVFGRLKTGVSREQALANLKSIAAQLEREYPADNHGRTVDLAPLSEAALAGLRGPAIHAAVALTVVVGFVLLIACANLANLLLVRSAKRTREIGIRIALGASRGRLIRQLLAESLVLAFAGGAGGLLAGLLGSRLLWLFRPPYLIWSVAPLRIDWHVLGFTAAVALLTGLLFGLAPAIHASAADLNSILKAGAGSRAQYRDGSHFQRVLVTLQIALAMVSLTGAGLFIRSMRQAESFQPGFDTPDVFLFWLDLTSLHYQPEQGREFLKSAVERAENTPGVRSAAVATIPPLAGGLSLTAFTEGQEDPTKARGVLTMVNTVSPAYFETVRLPVREGRVFSAFDRNGSQRVAVVSEAMARSFWPGQDAIGRRLRFSSESYYYEVVGVVGDITPIGGGATPYPMAYLPLDQNYQPVVALVVRAANHPAALVKSVISNVQPLDPNLALANEQTMSEIIYRGLWAPRMGAALFGIIGLLALGLAWMGTYAVIAYVVAQRTKEIGIRMALGAQRRRVISLVMRGMARMVAAGVAVGSAATLALGRFVASMLYDVKPRDPWSLVIAILLLFAAAALAAYLPARRALRVDPMIALRYE